MSRYQGTILIFINELPVPKKVPIFPLDMMIFFMILNLVEMGEKPVFHWSVPVSFGFFYKSVLHLPANYLCT